MIIKKLSFPKLGGDYLKKILQKKEGQFLIECGSVYLKKDEILPFKTLEYHEVAYLISGKLAVETKETPPQTMNMGDIIYLNKDEIRQTRVLEESSLIYFLFKSVKLIN